MNLGSRRQRKERWIPSFTCCAQDTVGLLSRLPELLWDYWKHLPFLSRPVLFTEGQVGVPGSSDLNNRLDTSKIFQKEHWKNKKKKKKKTTILCCRCPCRYAEVRKILWDGLITCRGFAISSPVSFMMLEVCISTVFIHCNSFELGCMIADNEGLRDENPVFPLLKR